MPRKYIRKVHVLRAHTSDGERYVEVVRYDGITITGVRFRLTKNGLYQVLWPRTRHVQVMVARGVTRHVIEAFKRYLDVHPWAVESANDAERETALVQVRELEHEQELEGCRRVEQEFKAAYEGKYGPIAEGWGYHPCGRWKKCHGDVWLTENFGPEGQTVPEVWGLISRTET